ncbi:hypothetical protein GE09DRAFT_581231 [Coniochaeta sp. 2T2.1]|nr:hypothetical protein GE09DRAFT_581231 [Coniochaeta sp. 2T2.1]
MQNGTHTSELPLSGQLAVPAQPPLLLPRLRSLSRPALPANAHTYRADCLGVGILSPSYHRSQHQPLSSCGLRTCYHSTNISKLVPPPRFVWHAQASRALIQAASGRVSPAVDASSALRSVSPPSQIPTQIPAARLRESSSTSPCSLSILHWSIDIPFSLRSFHLYLLRGLTRIITPYTCSPSSTSSVIHPILPTNPASLSFFGSQSLSSISVLHPYLFKYFNASPHPTFKLPYHNKRLQHNLRDPIDVSK